MLSTSRLDTLARIREVRMRSLAFVLVSPLLACSASAQHVDQMSPDAQTTSDAGGPLPPPPHGFQIVSPTVDVANGEESTYCYYFRTPNTGQLSIQRWVSHMPAAAHDMVLYLTPNDLMSPGTQTPTRCGIANKTGPLWTYSAETADAEAELPADDGTGQPIAQLVKAHQSGFLQIHYLNTTGSAVQAHVELNGYAYDDAIPVTWTGPFVTFRTNFEIGPGSTDMPTTSSVNGSCPVPLDDSGQPVKFFLMTTHTYKQGVHTAINDGTSTVFNSTNWAQPGAASFPAPFYSFKSSTLGYQCEYMNKMPYTIMTGDDPTLDELCMSISFYIPADPAAIGHYCLDSATVY
jgi:hypothetical protein